MICYRNAELLDIEPHRPRGSACRLDAVHVERVLFGKMGLWRAASKYPNAAFDFMISRSETWHVSPPEPSDARPSPEWAGPFRLAIPPLGWTPVRIWAHSASVEAAQAEFCGLVAAARRSASGDERRVEGLLRGMIGLSQ